ncbi:MAG: hypothetical protein DWQ42_06485 [Planctomycetota bacterium]|nr:MAG: hypothetical protein DWQ42_06485 [Planctomycetota bacterium]
MSDSKESADFVIRPIEICDVASIVLPTDSPNFQIRFRYNGKQYYRSLKTDIEEEALIARRRAEDMIRLIDSGRLEVPPDADPATFILSDGKRTGRIPKLVVRTLGDLFRAFQTSRVDGGKEDDTVRGEGRHIRHMKRHLETRRIAQSMIVGDIQRYVDLRAKDKWRGGEIGPETIEKEVRT